MMPTILLTAEEAIKRVPPRMREAAVGMGATPTQVVTKVIVPTALPGILTGVMLAVARAAGETAPLLFTALFSDFWMSRTAPNFLPKTLGDLMKPTASLAVLIYNFSGSPFDNQIAMAWSAALTLVVIVLVTNLRRPGPGQAIPPTSLMETQHVTCSRADQRTSNGRNGTQRAAADDTLIDCKIEELHYGKFKAVRDVALKIKKGHHHRLHRTLGMRQEHGAALPEPDERSGARLPLQRPRDLSRPGHLRLRRSIRSPCAATSGWCSSSPIRSR